MGEQIKVLVTGAGGQLGQCLQQKKDSYPGIKMDFRDKKDLDITSTQAIRQLFQFTSYRYCINTAAYTNVEQAEREPEKAFAINADAVGELARMCREFNVCLIHLSTDYVFDGEKNGPYHPGDAPNPINEYGKSKYEGERRIQETMQDYFIIRTSWLYSDIGENFYTKILARAKKGETLYVTDAQTGCPTRADHLASFLLGLVKNKRTDYGIHHFTDGKPMTWYDFACRILRENGLEGLVKIVRDKKSRSFAARPANSVLIGENEQ